jgi:predicted oxidoreductase
MKRPCVKKGPYYANRIGVGNYGSFAGLVTDENSRVLNKAGEPIGGLFVAGSTATSIFGGAYPGYGAMLGPGMTFGYQIGRDLASDKWSDEKS